jgi:hypothetical protein
MQSEKYTHSFKFLMVKVLIKHFKFRMFHMLHFSWGKGHGAGGKRLVIPLLCRFIPPFSTFIIYSLAPCSLLLAPYETEQAVLAKLE